MLSIGYLFQMLNVVIIFILLLRKYTVQKNVYEAVISFGFLIYLLKLIDIVLFPIVFDFPDSQYSFTMEIIPLKSAIDSLQYIGVKALLRQVGGNILLFVPLGFFTAIRFKKIKSTKMVTFLSFSISVLIEVLQGVINIITKNNSRAVDITDVLMNTIGGILGYAIFLIFRGIYIKYIGRSCFNILVKPVDHSIEKS